VTNHAVTTKSAKGQQDEKSTYQATTRAVNADGNRSQGKVEGGGSRGRGCAEAAKRIGEQRTAAKGPDEGVTDQTASSQKDDGGEDVQVPHAHVVPQHPTSTRQTAVSEAAGTSNPNPNGAGTTMPVGTSIGPPNESNENEKGRMEDEKGER
jgi:hypothetical protein